MKNIIENNNQLSKAQLLTVFGGAPLNFDPDYINLPLSQRKMGFPNEHGFTTASDGKIPMPFV
jgi:hypothetical protein